MQVNCDKDGVRGRIEHKILLSEGYGYPKTLGMAGPLESSLLTIILLLFLVKFH